MFEIESSKLAEQKRGAAEKSFASQMVTDHTKTSSEVKSVVNSAQVKAEIPSALDSSHQSKLDKLKSASGRPNIPQRRFRRTKMPFPSSKRYSKSGENAELKNWAAKTLPTLQHHLEMAQNINKGK